MHLLKHLAIGISFLFSISAFAAGPQVEIKTNLGTIHLELSPDKAPKSVENFLKYVKGVTTSRPSSTESSLDS